MNYLIIGGYSDIAADVIARLTESGHAIHALVRSEEQAQELQSQGHSTTVGDATKEGDIKQCIAEAKEKGLHRSELIRERLSQPPNHFGLTTSDFHKAVTKVRRRSSYGLDRQQAESLVATVFNELFSPGHGD